MVTKRRTAILIKPLNGCGAKDRPAHHHHGCGRSQGHHEGRQAAGVIYIDRLSRDIKEARAKVLVFCASTLESTRLLMNSGICGDNDALYKNLMDHIYRGGATRTMPQIESRAWAGPPRRPNGIYVPRFRNVKEKSTNVFIRGYGYQGGSSPNFNFGAPGFGESYKNAVRDTG